MDSDLVDVHVWPSGRRSQGCKTVAGFRHRQTKDAEHAQSASVASSSRWTEVLKLFTQFLHKKYANHQDALHFLESIITVLHMTLSVWQFLLDFNSPLFAVNRCNMMQKRPNHVVSAFVRLF